MTSDHTDLIARECPFCGEELDTNRLGNNPRHPDSDCFMGGQVIPFERLPAWNTRQAADALEAATPSERERALEAENASLRAMEARVRAAITYVEPADLDDMKLAIAIDLRSGMSLRSAAKKYATTFGIVRGVARTALEQGEGK